MRHQTNRNGIAKQLNFDRSESATSGSCSGRMSARRGFTLVELLTVMGIIALLSSMLLPALGRAKAKARRIACVSNLRQTGCGFHLWSTDHEGKFPWMASASDGGSQDLPMEAYWQYMLISGDLSTPKVLACPSDRGVTMKSDWNDFGSNAVQSLSYFAGLCASEQAPCSLLAGDRNLGGLRPLSECTNAPGLVAKGIRETSYWGTDLSIHGEAGNVVLADGSAHQLTTAGLRALAANSEPRTCSKNHVILPCPECVRR